MTQNERILALLETGPKTTAELLAEVPCIVHSRIAELRDRGHDIRHERVGASGASAHLYRLVPRVESEADCLGPDGSLSTGETGDVGYLAETSSGRDAFPSSEATAEQPPAEAVLVRRPSEPTQLTLTEAA